jgi:hypothetical protein
MSHGLRLSGDLRDLAALRTLVDVAPALLDAAWTEITADGRTDTVIVCAKLDSKNAAILAARGCNVVRVRSNKNSVTIAPVAAAEPRELDATSSLNTQNSQNSQAESWVGAVGRDVGMLIEAIRPVRVHGDPVVDEAVFWVPVEVPGAQRTIERLLALGRDDITVSEWDERGARILVARAQNPPMYLLMRSREEPHEGVRAFARSVGSLWVEWGYEHPLPSIASQALSKANRSAFVDRSGRWRIAPQPWTERSIFDAVVPTIDARRVELNPLAGESKFNIQLSLTYAPETVPEFWLLNPTQFASLEPFIEASTSDELSRFTIARLQQTDADGTQRTTYALREMIRPNSTRLGIRVTDIVGIRGWSRAAAADNLYLPVGRRLAPIMRRDELRKLLGLDKAQAVVIDEDTDGLRIHALMDVEEVPLTRWVEYMATERRFALDRMMESMVFDLPLVSVTARPKVEREKKSKDKDTSADDSPPELRSVVRSVRKAQPTQEAPKPVEMSEDEAKLREQAREIEVQIAHGGCEDRAQWHELGMLKIKLRHKDEAAQCLESALFHGKNSALDPQLTSLLLETRKSLGGATASTEEVLELCVRKMLLPSEASLLGAAALNMMAQNDAAFEMMAQPIAQRFSDPELPVSRRLAWNVLAHLARRTNDKLGMTRAKEKILGGLNERGLHEVFDLPGFVRFHLALDSNTEASQSTRADQVAALETLWSKAIATQLKELDANANFVRLLFAVGFARIGAGARAKELVTEVETELPAFDAGAAALGDPNPILFRLYIARLAHIATQGAPDAWEREVETIMNAVPEARRRDRAELFRKRSDWLRSGAPVEIRPNWQHRGIEAHLISAEAAPATVADAIGKVFEAPALFDHERTDAIERSLRATLRSGNEQLLGAALDACVQRLDAISILGHRASAIGACLQAAATLGDAPMVEKLLDRIVQIASTPDQTLSVRDLLLAVTPGIAALRKMGAGDAAARLLDALTPIAHKNSRDALRLRASIAEGFLQLRDTVRSQDLLDSAITESLTGSLDYNGRYDAMAAALTAMRRWPVAARAPRCEKIFDSIELFGDNFTTHRFYATYKLLVLEKLIDAVTDEITLRSDKVRGFLEGEEQIVRRQILADWRTL